MQHDCLFDSNMGDGQSGQQQYCMHQINNNECAQRSFVQLISQQAQHRIINRLVHKKPSVRPYRDPILTQLYVQCDILEHYPRSCTQKSISKNARCLRSGKPDSHSLHHGSGHGTGRSRALRDKSIGEGNTNTAIGHVGNTNTAAGEGNKNGADRQPEDQFRNKRTYSQSVQLPNLLRSGAKKDRAIEGSISQLGRRSIGVGTSTTGMGPKVVAGVGTGVDEFERTRKQGAMPTLAAPSSNSQTKQKLISIVQQVYRDSQMFSNGGKCVRSQERPKIAAKHTVAKKIKMERIKTLASHWQQNTFLKMDTYFVKLLRSKTHGQDYSGRSRMSDRTTANDLKPSGSALWDSKLSGGIPSRQNVSEFLKGYCPRNSEINVGELVKSANFKVILEEGKDIYFGGIEDGKRSGMGVYIGRSAILEGQWKNDEIVKGYEISSQGCYMGTFKENKRQGQGQFVWNNGQNYEGEWSHGLRHGTGVWKSGKGDSYIGHWARGAVEGYGVHLSATGQKYEGSFKNFLKHGRAKQLFPNGDTYDGEYRQGKPQGKGKYVWKSMVVYEGQFVAGYRHGQGSMAGLDGIRFEGEFTGERPNGNGLLIYANGDSYSGQFKNGDKDGFGTMRIKKDSKVVMGIWKNNQFCGEAT